MSRVFVRTLRDDPADAELRSHRLLVRAGYLRRVAPGIYGWLPLGLKVLTQVARVIREEMNAIGAQELSLPALLPREPYEASGRWTAYGPGMFRLQDRKGNDLLLGPTHEEIFTLFVKDLYSSYKDLPVSLYQIQTKYRDEPRPRAGILRGREFIMKDSYSFDLDDAGLAESYARHRAAYIKIFDRLGFEYVIVKAHSGAMGGSASEEFLAVSPAGEDTFVRSAGGYAANLEAAEVAVPPASSTADQPAAYVADTPASETIEALVATANQLYPRSDRLWQASDTLKIVLFKITKPGAEPQHLAVGVPGDREVDLDRLAPQLGEEAMIEPFTDADFAQYPDLVKGYVGPQVLGENSITGVKYLTDPRVVTGSVWIAGANETGKHVFSLVAGRDFSADEQVPVAEVRTGDLAPDGSGPLELARGIEIGHIFQLGKLYAEALGLQVLDAAGKLTTVTMGSYGIGVSRAVGAIAEVTADDKGLVWPAEIAPYHVHLVIAGKDEQAVTVAEQIAADLAANGRSVLIDDRAVGPGVKFVDAELLGMPTIVVVGRGLATGVVEVRNRATNAVVEVPWAEVATHLGQ